MPNSTLKSGYAGAEFISFDTQTGSSDRRQQRRCSIWSVRGAESCYPEEFLNSQETFKKLTFLDDIFCQIAECRTSRNTWKVIFPFVQVVSSVIQISFAMTHLGAVKNLVHIASMKIASKRFFFYLITFLYFLMSLGTSLVLSTYMANEYNGLYQLMAFLSILRLILPEATPAKKYFSPLILRFLTVFLPLIAHVPFYALIFHLGLTPTKLFVKRKG